MTAVTATMPATLMAETGDGHAEAADFPVEHGDFLAEADDGRKPSSVWMPVWISMPVMVPRRMMMMQRPTCCDLRFHFGVGVSLRVVFALVLVSGRFVCANW